MYDSKYLEKILINIENPVRYIGNELYSKVKDEALILLSYPDIYEIGMSNLGIAILRHVLIKNNFSCERVFAPFFDFEKFLRKENIPLFSLENKRPIKDFSVIGFSFECELNITNILNILELGKIPVEKSKRGEDLPIIIAGGTSVLNPRPWIDYFDAFVIGDGENPIIQIAKIAKKKKAEQISRKVFLKEISKIEGVYVPQLNNKVFYQYVDRLEYSDIPLPPILPFMQTIHDRFAIEISRGCQRQCKFCQAGAVSKNIRNRSAKDIIDAVKEGLNYTGWEEVSLLSLSVCDHPELDEILKKIDVILSKRRVTLSLPSLRVDAISDIALQVAGKHGHKTLTLAPEAGNESLRKKIGKYISDKKIFESLKIAEENGFSKLKFYFMVGLPEETEKDVESIADLISKIYYFVKKKIFKVSIAPFVPRPFSFYENEKLSSIDEINKKYVIIKNKLRNINVKIDYREPEKAIIEGILTRGDERVGKAALKVFLSGSRFDQWGEYFDYNLWINAFLENNVEISKEMIGENISNRWENIKVEKKIAVNNIKTDRVNRNLKINNKLIYNITKNNIFYRLYYEKKKKLRLLSHLDTTRAIIRTLKRASIPIEYSQGKRPKPIVSFGPPLPVGVTSCCEIFDFVCKGDFNNDFIDILNQFFPEGLKILSYEKHFSKPLPITSMLKEIVYIYKDINISTKKIDDVMKLDKIIVKRKKKKKSIEKDIREFIKNIKNTGNNLELHIKYNKNGSARLDEIDSLLEIKKEISKERKEIKL